MTPYHTQKITVQQSLVDRECSTLPKPSLRVKPLSEGQIIYLNKSIQSEAFHFKSPIFCIKHQGLYLSTCHNSYVCYKKVFYSQVSLNCHKYAMFVISSVLPVRVGSPPITKLMTNIRCKHSTSVTDSEHWRRYLYQEIEVNIAQAWSE